MAFILYWEQYSAKHRECSGSKGSRYVNNYLQPSVLSTTVKKMYIKCIGNTNKGTHSAMTGLVGRGDILAPL